MIVGAAVIVIAPWSSFRGQRGRVTQREPLMVLLDGERQPMRFGAREVVQEPEPQHIVAGE